jgi:hypothetical protein
MIMSLRISLLARAEWSQLLHPWKAWRLKEEKVIDDRYCHQDGGNGNFDQP